MIIREINIAEFGGIKDRNIILSPSFNLICGDNETGKSSTCAFIKFVLYGFSKPAERERYLNFHTKQCSGNLVIEDSYGKRFTVERSQNNTAKTNVKVYNSDGTENSDWEIAKTPGDYFLNLSEDLYTRSVYVSQEARTKLDSKTSDAITNLLVTGAEDVNVKTAKATLDKVRVDLQHKTGSGGKIQDIKRKIQSLKINFEQGSKMKGELEYLYNQIIDTEQEIYSLELSKEKLKQDHAKAKYAKINKLTKDRETFKIKESAAQYSQNAISEQFKCNDFLPDQDYINNIKELHSEYISQLKIYNGIQKNYEDLSAGTGSLSDSEKKAIEQAGGQEKIESLYSKNSSKRERNKKALITTGIISAIIIALSIFLAVYIGNPALLAISLINIPITSLYIYLIRKKSAKISETLDNLNSKLNITPERTLKTILRDYKEHDTLKRIFQDNLTINQKSLNEQREKLTESERKLKEKLALWGKNSFEEARDQYLKYSQSIQNLQSETEQNKTSLKIIEGSLAMYREDEIQSALSSGINDDSLAGKDDRYFADGIEKLDKSIKEKENYLVDIKMKKAEKSGKLPILSDIAVEIQNLENELEEKEQLYGAVTLAQSSLEQAEHSIKKQVTPYLCKEAGEIFKIITDGRYKMLNISNDFELMYGEGENVPLIDSEYLSVGSSDLAWLSIRLALHKKLSENETLPIILDECMVFFDDNRLKNTLDYIRETVKSGTQALIFSVSGREASMLSANDKIIRI